MMMMRQQRKFCLAVIIILLQPSTSMFSGNTVNALRRNAVVCFYVITIRKFASASYQGAADVVQYHQTTLSSFLSSFPLPTEYGICSTVCFILQLNLMFIIVSSFIGIGVELFGANIDIRGNYLIFWCPLTLIYP